LPHATAAAAAAAAAALSVLPPPPRCCLAASVATHAAAALPTLSVRHATMPLTGHPPIAATPRLLPLMPRRRCRCFADADTPGRRADTLMPPLMPRRCHAAATPPPRTRFCAAAAAADAAAAAARLTPADATIAATPTR
jgi:hypothetical protein